MTVKRRRYAPAVTLVEIMVAMVVLTIAALGALSYQYYAAEHAQVAKAQTTGTYIAQLLLEDWKSTGGSTEYDPTTLNLGFSSVLSEGSHIDHYDGSIHNLYAVTVDGVRMLVGLNWRDVAHDSLAQVTLRQLQVVAQVGEISEIYLSAAYSFLEGQDSVNPSLHVAPITLTTYVRLDASGG